MTARKPKPVQPGPNDPPIYAEYAALGMLLRLADLTPSPYQKRQIDPADPEMRSMLVSVKDRDCGVFEPVLVRPGPDGAQEMVWGHRRVWCSQQAGYETIPGFLRQLSDDEARRLNALENLDHKGLTPVEQAAQIADMLGGKAPTDGLEARIGRSKRWLAKRAALLRLHPDWLTEWQKNPEADDATVIARFTHAHMEALVSLPFESQLQALEHTRGLRHVPPARVFASEVARHFTRQLATAPWPLQARMGSIESCSACRKRSACHKLLFAEFDGLPTDKAAAEDRCLDAACWKQKMAAWGEQVREKAASTHGPDTVVVTTNPMLATEAGLASPDAIEGRETGPGTEGAVPALMIDGPRKGERVWLAPTEADDEPDSEAPAGEPASDVDRRAARVRRMQYRMAAQAIAALGGADRPAGVPEARRPTPEGIVAMAAVFGTGREVEFFAADHWTGIARHAGNFRDGGIAAVAAALLRDVLAVVDRRLKLACRQTAAAQRELGDTDAARLAAAFGLDWTALHDLANQRCPGRRRATADVESEVESG